MDFRQLLSPSVILLAGVEPIIVVLNLTDLRPSSLGDDESLGIDDAAEDRL